MYVHIRNVVYDLNFKKALKKYIYINYYSKKTKFDLIESSKFNVIHMCVDCIICLYNSALLTYFYFIVYFYRDNAQLKVIAPELADS